MGELDSYRAQVLRWRSMGWSWDEIAVGCRGNETLKRKLEGWIEDGHPPITPEMWLQLVVGCMEEENVESEVSISDNSKLETEPNENASLKPSAVSINAVDGLLPEQSNSESVQILSKPSSGNGVEETCEREKCVDMMHPAEAADFSANAFDEILSGVREKDKTCLSGGSVPREDLTTDIQTTIGETKEDGFVQEGKDQNNYPPPETKANVEDLDDLTSIDEEIRNYIKNVEQIPSLSQQDEVRIIKDIEEAKNKARNLILRFGFAARVCLDDAKNRLSSAMDFVNGAKNTSDTDDSHAPASSQPTAPMGTVEDSKDVAQDNRQEQQNISRDRDIQELYCFCKQLQAINDRFLLCFKRATDKTATEAERKLNMQLYVNAREEQAQILASYRFLQPKEAVLELVSMADIIAEHFQVLLENIEEQESSHILEKNPSANIGREALIAEECAEGSTAQDYLKQHQELHTALHNAQVAVNKLVESNLRIVIPIAKKFLGRGMEFADLIQEGNLGLIKAAEKFDGSRGTRFRAVAPFWVYQTIERAIANKVRAIRIPVHIHDELKQLQRIQLELLQEKGRDPSLDEIAEKIGYPTNRVRQILDCAQETLSLDRCVEDVKGHLPDVFSEEDLPDEPAGSIDADDVIEDKLSDNPSEKLDFDHLKAEFHAVLGSLKKREQEILALHFGLVNGTSHTLKEIGEKFGLTTERIRQIEAKALKKLRHPTRLKKLEGVMKIHEWNSFEEDD